MMFLDLIPKIARLTPNAYISSELEYSKQTVSTAQKWWDSNLTYEYNEDLEYIDKQIEKSVALNTPKSKL